MNRSLFGVVALAAVALTVVLIGTASAAKPPAPTNSAGPTSPKNLKTADNVGASVANSGSTSTYTFDSFVDQNPVNGTPGLTKYCVYTTPAPSSVETDAEGDDGSDWTASKSTKSFSFSRPGGEKTNIPLDGESTEVGKATWTIAAPAVSAQTIVLHISDSAKCAALYGGTSPTCFVLPGASPTGTLTVNKTMINDNGGDKEKDDFSFTVNGTTTPFDADGSVAVSLPVGTYTVTEPAVAGYTPSFSGSGTGNSCTDISITSGGTATCSITNDDNPPICDAGTGNTGAAYNAIPTDVEHCSPPSLGFEATQTNEFGDEVMVSVPAPALAGSLHSVTVDFQSYGCSVSGHWNTGDCVTTPGATFSIPDGITANIYNPNGPGGLTTPIASATIDNLDIPFRPTADPLCTGADAGKWFDPFSAACNNSLSVPITFHFQAGTVLSNNQIVVWTVEFNTSTEGYLPIGPAACSVVNAGDPGCGYDSLNVGAKSYPGAPYAGFDVDANVAYRSYQGNGDVLAPVTGWAANRPLGQIVVTQ